jgi:hypothetical protein
MMGHRQVEQAARRRSNTSFQRPEHLKHCAIGAVEFVAAPRTACCSPFQNGSYLAYIPSITTTLSKSVSPKARETLLRLST